MEDWNRKGYSQYGASMGRDSYGSPRGRISLRKVPINSGGYDPGGAYWGSGATLWYASGDDYGKYFRAPTKEKAKELVRNAVRSPYTVSFRGEGRTRVRIASHKKHYASRPR